MGRSRTMNDTRFSIYKSGAPAAPAATTPRTAAAAASPTRGTGAGRFQDIKKLELTRALYVKNCDQKMAGNLSSIYQTLIALLNLSSETFYYRDEIVNTFLEKMQATIGGKVARHELRLVKDVLGEAVPARIFAHILADKFRRSASSVVSACRLEDLFATGSLGSSSSSSGGGGSRGGSQSQTFVESLL